MSTLRAGFTVSSGTAYGPVTVPADHLLVLGDDRNNSFDGRFWGFLPAESVQGVVALRYWPPWRAGTVH